jgi:hypothetical protein
MLFFTEIFHLLVLQTNLYYQKHSGGQTGRSRRLPDITLPDMIIMNFFSSPRLSDDLDRRKINSFAQYGPAEKICPGPK